MYHHRGSTCDPAGILILVLLTSNTRVSMINSLFEIVWISIFGKGGKKNVYENDTSIKRINEKKIKMKKTHP